jgi:hypothetical protein
MDGDDAACGAFDEFRCAVGERSKDIDGLGHGKFSSTYLRDRDLASGKTRRYWPDGRVAMSWTFSKIAGFPPAAVIARSLDADFIGSAGSNKFGFCAV